MGKVHSKHGGEPSLKDYKHLEEIGKGAFGVVYRAKRRSDHVAVAIKRVDLDKLSDEKVLKCALSEAEKMSRATHPNIIQIYAAFQQGDTQCFIVMEYCSDGDLHTEIQKRKANNWQYFKEAEIMLWFVQIVDAIDYLHSEHIIHRDIKTQNIFLSDQKRVIKVGDFGIATVVESNENNSKALTSIGTETHAAPEIGGYVPYTNKVDVWSTGIVLYELVTLKLPFQSFAHAARGIYPSISEETGCSKETERLIARMLTVDPDKRPSMAQIVGDGLLLSYSGKIMDHYQIETQARDPITGEETAQAWRKCDQKTVVLHKFTLPQNASESVADAIRKAKDVTRVSPDGFIHVNETIEDKKNQQHFYFDMESFDGSRSLRDIVVIQDKKHFSKHHISNWYTQIKRALRNWAVYRRLDGYFFTSEDIFISDDHKTLKLNHFALTQFRRDLGVSNSESSNGNCYVENPEPPRILAALAEQGYLLPGDNRDKATVSLLQEGYLLPGDGRDEAADARLLTNNKDNGSLSPSRRPECDIVVALGFVLYEMITLQKVSSLDQVDFELVRKAPVAEEMRRHVRVLLKADRRPHISHVINADGFKTVEDVQRPLPVTTGSAQLLKEQPSQQPNNNTNKGKLHLLNNRDKKACCFIS